MVDITLDYSSTQLIVAYCHILWSDFCRNSLIPDAYYPLRGSPICPNHVRLPSSDPTFSSKTLT
jgi:hypothetical protein